MVNAIPDCNNPLCPLHHGGPEPYCQTHADMLMRRLLALGDANPHSPDCDTLDLNPEGIVKPCNCRAKKGGGQ